MPMVAVEPDWEMVGALGRGHVGAGASGRSIQRYTSRRVPIFTTSTHNARSSMLAMTR